MIEHSLRVTLSDMPSLFALYWLLWGQLKHFAAHEEISYERKKEFRQIIRFSSLEIKKKPANKFYICVCVYKQAYDNYTILLKLYTII